MTLLSRRALESPQSGIRKMFGLAAKMTDLANLGIGEPDFATPPEIVEAAVRALREGATKYTSNAGIPPLREVIMEKLSRENNLPGTPDNVIVTAGACEALILCLMAVTDPGDEVIIPDPCWSNYMGEIHLAGGRAVPARTYKEDRFHLKASTVKSLLTEKTRVLFLNTPSNPTGAVLGEADLKELAALAIEHNLMVVSDEPYEKLVYDGRRHVSIGSLPGMAERTLTVNSFSKAFAMTGWRVGYVHGPEEVVGAMVKLHESFSSCVNSAAQFASIEAMQAGAAATAAMVESYQKRRDLLVEGLNTIPGVECLLPEGAFYAFPDISSFGKSSADMALDLLTQAKVVAVPGDAFGQAGEGFLRMCYAASEETLEKAVDRMRKYLAGR